MMDATTVQSGFKLKIGPRKNAKQRQLRIRQSELQNWLEIIGVMMPSIILVLLSIRYSTFIGHAVNANPALNLSILAVLLLGIVMMFRTVWFVVRQRTIATEWFDSEGDPIGRSSWRASHRLSLVGESLVRMFEKPSSNDAAGLNESVENEADQVYNGLHNRLVIPGYLVGAMVALGLLGTFIGLLETLASISTLVTDALTTLDSGGAVEAAITKMVGQLRSPLNSMATAFSASMFGVTGSVVLGVLLALVTRSMNRFSETFRDDVHEHAQEVIIKQGLADNNQMTVGFLRQHLGVVVEAIQRQSLAFEMNADQAVQASANMRAAIESVQLMANVSTDLAMRLQSVEGVVTQLESLNRVALEQADHARRLGAAFDQVVAQGDRNHSDMLAVEDSLAQLRMTVGSSFDDVKYELDRNGSRVIASIEAQTDRVVRQVERSAVDMVDSNEPLLAMTNSVKVLEELLHSANHEFKEREDRSVAMNARLAGALQVMKDTVSSMALSQEEGLRQVLARVEKHVIDLKGHTSGTEEVMRSVSAKNAESAAALQRHTGILEGVRTALEARRADWVRGLPMLKDPG